MKKCKTCGDEYAKADVGPGGVCHWCAEKRAFADFARSCGLTRFPDPSGERYVCRLDGACDGKKGECVDFMDELWDALVRAKGGADGLLLKKE